jgi:hypothetical protein
MDEKEFDPIDFVNRLNEFSGMTFAQSASKSLGNIIDKLLEHDAGESFCHINLVDVPLNEVLGIIRGEK